MFAEMDKIVAERSHLQEIINKEMQYNDQKSPIFERIDEWQKKYGC